jgi:hypothetical protein
VPTMQRKGLRSETQSAAPRRPVSQSRPLRDQPPALVRGHAALAVQPVPCHFPGMLSQGGRPAKRPGIARKQGGRVRLFTRRGYDWTEIRASARP